MATTPVDANYIAWKGWQSDFGSFSREDDVYFSKELKLSGVRFTKHLRVFEFGFGNGPFAGWAHKRGATWTGIEANGILVERARRGGFDAHHIDQWTDASIAPESQDLAVAFDVFEHLSLAELRDVLRRVLRTLKGGGLLVGRMPSGDSPFVGSIFNGDLTHRTLIGSSAVRQLATENGYSPRAVRETALPIAGLGPRRAVRRAVVRCTQMIAYSAIRNLLIGDATAVLSPNLTFVLEKR